ncbi:MAG: hypothetical protein Q4F17_05325 [Eubacteriales bacterium]|nr:hypothetical protein [Eubacteriales bacterium]
MTRKDIVQAYDSITPTEEEKQRMRNAILSAVPRDLPVRKEMNMKNHVKKSLVIAALVAVTVFLMGAAAVFSMKDLKVGEYSPPTQAGQTQQTEARDMISLQGFASSPSFKATKEWREFEESYDPDYTKLQKAEEAGYQAPEAYTMYPCYTQEMVDKVDAICKKYNLKPLGKLWGETDHEKMFQMLGIPGITAPGAKTTLYSGYYFEGGTFQIEGDAGPYSFQYRCSMKDTLDYVHLVVGNIEDYAQWNYALPDETVLLLALSRDKALILADQDSYFASISVLSPGNMTQEDLEALAASFDFSYVPQKVDPAKADAREAEEEAEYMAKMEKQTEKIEAEYKEKYNVDSYAELVTNLKEKYKQNGFLEEAQYTLVDINGDGTDELITGRDNHGWSIYTMKDGKTHNLNFYEAIYLCDDGVIHHDDSFESEEQGNWIIHGYYRMNGTEVESIVRVAYNPNDGQWAKYTNANPLPDEIITEAEAMEIINSYKDIELDWKPITEFPMN